MDHEIISSFHSSFLEEFLEVGGQGEGDFSTGEGGGYPCFPNLNRNFTLVCFVMHAQQRPPNAVCDEKPEKGNAVFRIGGNF